MKPTLTVAASVLLLALAGCATFQVPSGPGRIDAGINLPLSPEECSQRVPHPSIAPGQELRSIARREHNQLDVANDRLLACDRFYQDVREGFAHGS